LTSRHWKPLAVVAAVTVAHLWLMSQMEDLARLGSGAADTSPARIDVAFVRELAPAEPPPAVAVRAPPAAQAEPAPVAAAAPLPAASAPLEAAPVLEAAQLAAASETEPKPEPKPEPVAPQPEAAAAATPAPTAESSASSAAPTAQAPQALPAAPGPAAPPSAPPSAIAPAEASAFEWPPSTRLSYNLVGDYRGPVQGKARVEWLRSGNRYQVHLDVRVGADFAPLLSRRMSSDGVLTEAGLKPQRYDEETKVLLREVRRQTIFFEPERIVLPRGGVQPTVAGVQDTASQFVQLSWMFTLQPQLLRTGQTVEVPLALARRVDRWVYDVVGEEVLDLPVGPVKAWYLKPRPQSKTNSDLSVETWFAPTLQYLPVRIRIRQDEASFIDLTLERLPQQASASEAPPPRRIVPP
jgi:hypothetical protein